MDNRELRLLARLISNLELETQALRKFYDHSLHSRRSRTAVPPRPDLSTYKIEGTMDFYDLLHDDGRWPR